MRDDCRGYQLIRRGTRTGGDIVQRDLKLAFQLLEKAAIGGLPDAQANLGWAYMSNYLELTPNYKLAMDWSLKAYNQGIGEASSNIGLLYENGWGVPVDYAKAYSWHFKAIEQEDANVQATFHLDVLYETGRGIRKDLRFAEELYQIVIKARGNEGYKDEAISRLQFVQDLLMLQGNDDVKYPEEVTPKRGRPALRHGKGSWPLPYDLAKMYEQSVGC